MCHFITATLAAGTDREALQPFLDRYGMDFSPVDHPYLRSRLPQGDLYVRATDRACDCGTALGSLRRGSGIEEMDAERQKLKKKGWSDSKIARWSEEKKRGTEHQGSHELEQWNQFIHSIIDQGITPRLGLLLHWYTGGLAEEDFQILGREQVPVREIGSGVLGRIKEDVLYEFVTG